MNSKTLMCGGVRNTALNLIQKAMTKVRAKFECVGITDQPENELKTVSFSPVIEGSEENKSFSKYTPAGSLELQISYETEASNAFEEGAEYYLDITKAE